MDFEPQIAKNGNEVELNPGIEQNQPEFQNELPKFELSLITRVHCHSFSRISNDGSDSQ